MALIPYGDCKFFNADLIHTLELESSQGGSHLRVFIRPTVGNDVVLYDGPRDQVEEIIDQFNEVPVKNSMVVERLAAHLSIARAARR